MRNEEERYSAKEAGKTNLELARERLKNKNTKVAIGILVALIAVSVLLHFIA